ncbi:MAG TPA: hypothetical protein VNO50_15235 [Pyrinomonadaceae bacterium]|nr:hypothetical protein [Pyrinomonadaceae bacterium]
MSQSFSASRLSRQSILLLLISLLIATSGCGLFVKPKKVQVPQLLKPLAEADKPLLLNEINRLTGVQSVQGKVDIQFEDTSFAESGIVEKYRQTEGSLVLQRPGKIYLGIQFSFVDIAQMSSDGERFRVAVLRGDEKYKRFVKGTNSAVYPKLEESVAPANPKAPKKPNDTTEKEAVSALSNLRPQHLTDALMIQPAGDPALVYVKSEFFQEESDSNPQAKKGARVVRGYYLLEEFTQPSAGESRLVRRFWFDRVNSIRLARVQFFDSQGLLLTDVSYSNETSFGEGSKYRLPSRIEITRPHDQYKLTISYQAPATVGVDKEFRPEAFILENKGELPEVDLDERLRNRTNPSP